MPRPEAGARHAWTLPFYQASGESLGTAEGVGFDIVSDLSLGELASSPLGTRRCRFGRDLAGSL